MATAVPPASSSASVTSRSQAVKLRRGLAMLGMNLVVPGSAQLAAGNRRLGRVGVRVWLTLVLLAVVTAVMAFAARGLLVTVATSGWVLWLASFFVLAVGAVWAFLMVNAWATARPAAMGAVRGTLFSVIAAVLVGAIGVGTWTASSAMRASGNVFSSVFAGGGDSQATAGRINILLLGADAGDDREGLRPDSIMVASVDAKTGRAILFGLPRNLEDVPFPDSSPLKKLYPKGYGCPDHSCLLNAIYTLGEEHKNLYPGVKRPGVQAMREAVGEVLGLKINYYAMVDMKGFESLVNAVGGVRIDLNKRTPLTGGSGKGDAAYIWLEPKKDMLLDGHTALEVARSRYGSTDYERMVRQRCVLNAMLNQLDPVTVSTKYEALAAVARDSIMTDVPADQINGLADLALKTRSLPTSSVAFTPPQIAPGTPNYAKIREMVKTEVARTEALDKPGAAPTTTAPAPAPASTSAAPTRTSAAPSTKAAPASSSGPARPTAKPATTQPEPPAENAPVDPASICVAR